MLSEKINKLLNEQIQKEMFSSNLYLSMACWAEDAGYEGISNWLHAQAQEEQEHAIKFIKYMGERGGKVTIELINKPENKFESIEKLFDAVYEHEKYISKSIHNLVTICFDEKDHATYNWLQWFVTEQLQEEASVKTIIDKLKLVGRNNMYVFDRDIMNYRNEE